MENKLYPWMNLHWKKLNSMKKNSRLPHCLLLNGRSGIGKEDLAFLFAKKLLCENENIEHCFPCNLCNSCVLFEEKSHPDFFSVTDKKILFDQVKKATAFLLKTNSVSSVNVLIMSKAENITVSGVNAFLKILEDSSKNAVIIFISDNIAHVASTLASRCLIINFFLDKDIIFKWFVEHVGITSQKASFLLKLFYFSPLLALKEHENVFFVRDLIMDGLTNYFNYGFLPFDNLQKIKDKEAGCFMQIFFSIMSDVIKIRLCFSQDHITNIDLYDDLLFLSKKLELNDAFKWFYAFCSYKRSAKEIESLNYKLTFLQLFNFKEL